MDYTKRALTEYLCYIEGCCIRKDLLFPAFCIPAYVYNLDNDIYSIDQILSVLVIDIGFDLYIKNDEVPIKGPISQVKEEREITPFFVCNYALALYKKNNTPGNIYDFHEARIFFEKLLERIIPGVRNEISKKMLDEVFICTQYVYKVSKRREELHYFSVLYDILFDRGYFLTANQVHVYQHLTTRRHESNKLFAHLILHLALDKYNNNGSGITYTHIKRPNGFDDPKNIYKTALQLCPPYPRQHTWDLHKAKEFFECFISECVPGIDEEWRPTIPILAIL